MAKKTSPTVPDKKSPQSRRGLLDRFLQWFGVDRAIAVLGLIVGVVGILLTLFY